MTTRCLGWMFLCALHSMSVVPTGHRGHRSPKFDGRQVADLGSDGAPDYRVAEYAAVAYVAHKCGAPACGASVYGALATATGNVGVLTVRVNNGTVVAGGPGVLVLDARNGHVRWRNANTGNAFAVRSREVYVADRSGGMEALDLADGGAVGIAVVFGPAPEKDGAVSRIEATPRVFLSAVLVQAGSKERAIIRTVHPIS